MKRIGRADRGVFIPLKGEKKMKSSWNETRTIQIELEFHKGEFYDESGKAVPPEVNELLCDLVSDCLDFHFTPADLFIEFTSSGWYDPGCTYGPPENCYPPEGDDERTMEYVEFKWCEREILLTQEQQQIIFDAYEELVNAYELE